MNYTLRSRDVVTESIDGEVVIIDLDSGSYFSLEGCGGYIWECLVSGMSTASILSRLQSAFPEEADSLGAKFNVLLESLLEADLIVTTDEQTETVSAMPNLPKNCDQMVMQCYTDMQELLMLDPIHEVEEAGWPKKREDA